MDKRVVAAVGVLFVTAVAAAPAAHADRWGDDTQARAVWVCETLMAEGMPMRVHRVLAVRMVLQEKEGYTSEKTRETMDDAVTVTCPGAEYSYMLAVTHYSMAPPESREVWENKAAPLVEDL